MTRTLDHSLSYVVDRVHPEFKDIFTAALHPMVTGERIINNICISRLITEFISRDIFTESSSPSSDYYGPHATVRELAISVRRVPKLPMNIEIAVYWVVVTGGFSAKLSRAHLQLLIR